LRGKINNFYQLNTQTLPIQQYDCVPSGIFEKSEEQHHEILLKLELQKGNAIKKSVQTTKITAKKNYQSRQQQFKHDSQLTLYPRTRFHKICKQFLSSKYWHVLPEDDNRYSIWCDSLDNLKRKKPNGNRWSSNSKKLFRSEEQLMRVKVCIVLFCCINS
jgi:hypothetical protein